MSSRETLEMMQAMGLLFTSRPIQPVQVLFFHSLPPGEDDKANFSFAASFYQRMVTNCIIINGSLGEKCGGSIPREAWAGGDAWERRLRALGVRNILMGAPGCNTKEENNAYLALAKENDVKSAALLTRPYHLLRAMLGMVRSMRDMDYPMKVYPIFSEPTDWKARVFGPQGAEKLPQFQFIEGEIARIGAYQAKGDLATLHELIDYLLALHL